MKEHSGIWLEWVCFGSMRPPEAKPCGSTLCQGPVLSTHLQMSGCLHPSSLSRRSVSHHRENRQTENGEGWRESRLLDERVTRSWNQMYCDPRSRYIAAPQETVARDCERWSGSRGKSICACFWKSYAHKGRLCQGVYWDILGTIHQPSRATDPFDLAHTSSMMSSSIE